MFDKSPSLHFNTFGHKIIVKSRTQLPKINYFFNREENVPQLGSSILTVKL